MIRRYLAVPGGIALAILVWLGGLAIAIWSYGQTDRAEPSDCAIVLGAAIQGDRPSPVFEERIRHALQLYRPVSSPRSSSPAAAGTA